MGVEEDFAGYLEEFGEVVLHNGGERDAIVDREHSMISGPDGVVSINEPSIQSSEEEFGDIVRGDIIEAPLIPGSEKTVRYQVHDVHPDGLGWFVAQMVRAPDALEISHAEVSESGDSIAVSFSAGLLDVAGEGWAVTADAVSVDVLSVQHHDNQVVLETDPVFSGQEVLLGFDASSGTVRAVSGVELDSVSAVPVDNNSALQALQAYSGDLVRSYDNRPIATYGA